MPADFEWPVHCCPARSKARSLPAPSLVEHERLQKGGETSPFVVGRGRAWCKNGTFPLQNKAKRDVGFYLHFAECAFRVHGHICTHTHTHVLLRVFQASAASDDEKLLLRAWYVLDENTVPPSHRLKVVLLLLLLVVVLCDLGFTTGVLLANHNRFGCW